MTKESKTSRGKNVDSRDSEKRSKGEKRRQLGHPDRKTRVKGNCINVECRWPVKKEENRSSVITIFGNQRWGETGKPRWEGGAIVTIVTTK